MRQGNWLILLACLFGANGADKKWIWNDNRRSTDSDPNGNSGTGQNAAASAGQITLKLDNRPENDKYSQRPAGDTPSSDQPYDYDENIEDTNPNQGYFRPGGARPGYNPSQGERYPAVPGRFPGQGGRYPGNYQGGPFRPDRPGYDRFAPGNPSQFSYNNAPFRPSRPFAPGLEGPYPGPRPGNIPTRGKCSCVPHYNCGPPAVLGGQCAPGKSVCCFDRFGGPGAPIRRPPIHSIANGVLAGPGGPVDPLPGGNFIPGPFDQPFGGPYGQGPRRPYGNGFDEYARKTPSKDDP